jgi:hypothetical protein
MIMKIVFNINQYGSGSMKRLLSAVLLLFIALQGTSFAQSTNSTDRIQELEKKIEELRGQLKATQR